MKKRMAVAFAAVLLLAGCSASNDTEISEEPKEPAVVEEAKESDANPTAGPEESGPETVIPLSGGRTVKEVLTERTVNAGGDESILEDQSFLQASAQFAALKWYEEAIEGKNVGRWQKDAEAHALMTYASGLAEITPEEAQALSLDVCESLSAAPAPGLVTDRMIVDGIVPGVEDATFVIVASVVSLCPEYLDLLN